MARKITTDAINAFMNGENFSRDNTSVSVNSFGDVVLMLHGNQIAQKRKIENDLQISNAGWFSTTTKERLNGLPGVSVCQRKGVWFLNGEEWDGTWKVVV